MFIPTWIEREKVDNLDSKGKLAVSTQVHCVKSIKSYPFNPAMNEIRCCELKRKVEDTGGFINEYLEFRLSLKLLCVNLYRKL
ncbi:Arginine kinase [Formica fusca]